MQNSMVVFTFFVFNRKRPFWENLVQKIKIVSLGLNLVASLIRICRNTLFAQIWFKMSELSAEAEIWYLD